MEILKLLNVSKHYPTFDLKNVSFTLESGKIMGFIGRNGAGKTTTLKTIMNIISIDSGEIYVFGKELFSHLEEIKQNIGFVLNGIDFFPSQRLKSITAAYSRFFENWDQERYLKYIEHFDLDERKKLQELSQGMKVKYLLALALSHDAKLLILDEPTSGLDPISREEILDIFLSIIKKEDRAILFSTHITSDLDKVADQITYIRDGEIITSMDKNELISRYKIIHGLEDLFDEDDLSKMISYKVIKTELKGLIETENQDYFINKNIKVDNAVIDDIIVYLEKVGENDAEEFDL